MYKKYRIVADDTISIKDNAGTNERKLYRIVAVRSFGMVREGALGGYIESEDNLSHEGSCWVSNHAKVYDDARVYGDAIVYDGARVHDKAEVCDHAKIYGYAEIYGDAEIRGETEINGNAKICVHAAAG